MKEMPHALIAKLVELEQHPFQPINPNADTVLGEKDCPNEIPDDVFDLLDKIRDGARAVFGVAEPPTPAQERIMSSKGFLIHWRKGTIRTKKGWVRYR